MTPTMTLLDVEDVENIPDSKVTIPKKNGLSNRNLFENRYRRDFILDVFDLIPSKDPPSRPPSYDRISPTKTEIRKAFRILRFTMMFMGTMPVTINRGTTNFEFRWKSFSCVHCLVSIGWLTSLFICSCIGLIRFVTDHLSEDVAQLNPFNSTNGNGSSFRSLPTDFWTSYGIEAKQLLGILVILSCVFNACIQSLTIFYKRERIASYMNNWSGLIFEKRLNPLSGLRLVSSSCSVFLFIMGTLFIIACYIGIPAFLSGIIEAFARVILMVPKDMVYSPLTRKVVRLCTATVTIHSYMVHKTSMLIFATNSKLLANSFECWRKQFKESLHAAWNPAEKGPRGRCLSFSQLNESHGAIVEMLRQTEDVFAPILEFFYASAIVSMCAMLYFIASQRNGLTNKIPADDYLWQGFIVGQFVFVFVIVTLSASNVHVQSERCYDVLRRGLPFEASDRDKFFFAELVRSITLSHLAISGNRFFDITKPFLLTIVGVILSYFIIILQLQNP